MSSHPPVFCQRLDRIARLTFLLGIADIVKLLPEQIAVGGPLDRGVLLVGGVDMLLGCVAIRAGRRLRRGAEFMPSVAGAWGALIPNALFYFWLMAPHYFGFLGRMGDTGPKPVPSSQLLIFLARFLFSGAVLALTPFVLWALSCEPAPPMHPRGDNLAAFGAGLLLSLVLAGILMVTLQS